MQKITPFLWFNTNAEEALEFYAGIFKSFKVTSKSYWGKGGPGPEGTLMTAAFELEGQGFVALNGGPVFTFTEAISFMINCETPEEVDHYWDKLSSNGGTTSQCGWLKDKFGLSWQVVPTVLTKLAGNSDKKKVGSMMQAMMKMTKLDTKILQDAFDNG